MEEDTEKYKNYKAYLITFLIISIFIFIFTDNFLQKYIKTRIEYCTISYGFYPKNINIKSNINYKNQSKIKNLVPKNQSIFTLDLHALYNNIIRIPEIKTAQLKRKLFDTIEINLELYEPIAKIAENSLLLCKDGSVIKNFSNKKNFTSIRGINNRKNFLNLYNKINNYKVDIINNISTATFNSQNIELKFNNSKIISLNYDFSKDDLLKQLTQ